MAAYAPPTGYTSGSRPRSVRGGNAAWRAGGPGVPSVQGGVATLHSRSPQDGGSDDGVRPPAPAPAQGTAVAAMRVASNAADADAAAGVSPLFVRRADARPFSQTGPRAKTPGPVSRTGGRPAVAKPPQGSTQAPTSSEP